MRNRKGNKKMRFLARIISLLLVVILVSEEFLGSGNIVLAAPQDEISVVEDVSNENDTGSLEGALPEEGQEEDSSEEPQILFEVEGLREEGTKQFRLSDGTIMAAEYGMDVHYKDENDEWQDIDNRFRYEAADGDGPEGFVTAEGAVQFKFAPEISDGEVVRATSGEYSVGFSLRSGRGEDGSEAILEEDGAAGAAGILLEDGETVPAGETENNLSQDEELLSSPITFIKGDILNQEEAAEVLAEAVLAADVSAEDTVQAEGASRDSTLEAAAEELPEVVWAGEFAQEDAASGEEETLLEQASADNAVTSVGYGNILPGVSLQYVAYGSSLKEYILINEVQEDYHYEFDLDLENLVPQMQEDGSILLKDAENGTVVYEIPAAYMTDGAGCYSDAVEMVLLENGDGGYLLAVDADPEWIEAEERVFPVQIDPTLNRRLSSTTGIRGNYVCDAKETESSANYGWMYVGYDSSGNGNMTTFIQLKDLPSLPEGSVICSSMFNMYVVSYSQSAWPKMHVLAREVTSETSWSSAYTFKTRPSVSSEILDYRTITSGSVNSYVGWNITELVKEHYESGNASGDIFAFSLEACGTMSSTKCANTALNLTWDGAEPVLQIFYRDTRGVEGYYTYQVQDLGNAGTGYVGDYTSQLTVSKTAASYASSIFPYSLDLVYNSASSGSYFSKIGDIHTTDYSGMILGTGWKLSAQETVVAVSVEDLESTTTYLAYNDGDGTEHYFKRSDSDSTKYEDEDGLNLTIKKSGTTYTMTDKQDNVKTFKKGFLTNIKDANGNQMHIVYNGNAYTSNTIKADGTDRITSVVF